MRFQSMGKYEYKESLQKIVCLSSSSTLSINDKRPQGFKKAFADSCTNNNAVYIISGYSNTAGKYKIVK